MIKISTLQGTAFWRQRIALDGTDFLLDFAWNGREEAWHISLFAADETPLVMGLKLVSNRPIWARFKSLAGMPVGELVALDSTGKIEYAGFEQLGTDVKLYYFEAADL